MKYLKINRLMLKTMTWNKESNELHDYESEEKTKNQIETRIAGSIIKNDENELIFLSQLDEEKKKKALISIENNEDTFFLKKVNCTEGQLTSEVNSTNSIWLVIKNFKSLHQKEVGYPLVEGDVIKLGRVKLKIREIRMDNNLDDSLNNNSKHFHTKMNEKSNLDMGRDNNNIRDSNTVKKANEVKNELPQIIQKQIETKKKTILCRICYCDDKDIDSPLIQPCSCSGTMKYIHFVCLQKWLKSKAVPKNNLNENCLAYSLKQIECELCKSLLPDFIKYKDKIYDIWDFKPKFKSYMIFETMITEKNTTRVIYILNIEKKDSIRLGRGHDSDIRLSDISVSRFHSIIKIDKIGRLTIQDNESKFGTLILLQHPKLPIIKNNNLEIQIGRIYLLLSIKASSCVLSCFNSNNKKYKGVDYQTLNAQHILFENTNFIKVQNEYSITNNYDTNSLLFNKEDKDEYMPETPNDKPVFFKEINDNPNNITEINMDIRDGQTRLKLERANTNEFYELAHNQTNLNLMDIREKVNRDLFQNEDLREIEGEISNNENSNNRNRNMERSQIDYSLEREEANLNQINIEINLNSEQNMIITEKEN